MKNFSNKRKSVANKRKRNKTQLLGNQNSTTESVFSKRPSLVNLGPIPTDKKFIKQLPPSKLEQRRFSHLRSTSKLKKSKSPGNKRREAARVSQNSQRTSKLDNYLEISNENNTGLMSSPYHENEMLEEYISDGNTGATREMYHLSKQQLREQVNVIKEKLMRKGVPAIRTKVQSNIANAYTPQENLPEKKKRRKRKTKITGNQSVDRERAQLIGLLNSDK